MWGTDTGSWPRPSDVNPFPDKARLLKTWIHEDSGPDASVDEALRAAGRFSLKAKEAKEALGEVEDAVARWRDIAREPGVGMTATETEQFFPAFEHPERKAAQKARATVSARGGPAAPGPAGGGGAGPRIRSRSTMTWPAGRGHTRFASR